MATPISPRKVFGILPMAGKGSRIQRLGFPKELYPVVFARKHFAVSEFCVRALEQAKVDEIKLVITSSKMEIASYYADYNTLISVYVHEQAGKSLPDACLFPLSSIGDNDICLFGLPDTIFSPSNGFSVLRKRLEVRADIVLGLFKVEDGSKFDSVGLDNKGNVTGVLVKQSPPLSNWIWGIWGAKGKALRELRKAIDAQKTDGERLLGVGFHKLAKSGKLVMVGEKIGTQFFDIGTMEAAVKANQVVQGFDLKFD